MGSTEFNLFESFTKDSKKGKILGCRAGCSDRSGCFAVFHTLFKGHA